MLYSEHGRSFATVRFPAEASSPLRSLTASASSSAGSAAAAGVWQEDPSSDEDSSPSGSSAPSVSAGPVTPEVADGGGEAPVSLDDTADQVRRQELGRSWARKYGARVLGWRRKALGGQIFTVIRDADDLSSPGVPPPKKIITITVIRCGLILIRAGAFLMAYIRKIVICWSLVLVHFQCHHYDLYPD